MIPRTLGNRKLNFICSYACEHSSALSISAPTGQERAPGLSTQYRAACNHTIGASLISYPALQMTWKLPGMKALFVAGNLQAG